MKKSHALKFIPLYLTLALAGCSTHTGIKSSYQQQDYIRTIETIMSESNKTTAQSAQQNLTQSENIYKALMLSQNSNHPVAIAFHQKYSIDQVRKNLAKDYYQLAKNYPQDTYTELYERYVLYFASAQLDPTTDAEQLAQRAHLKYATNQAEEYYTEGKKFERLKNHELASQSFQKAQEAYKNYGAYKDSAQRFRTNDEKWRKKHATSLISSAQAAENSGFGQKESYRMAAREYQRAHETYAPYGNIENSKELAQSYQQKGIVRYQYHIAANNIDKYCHYDFSNNLKNDTGQKIDYVLQNKGFRPANANPNDWSISIMYELYYKQQQPTDVLFIKATLQSTGIINEAEIVMTDINTEQTNSNICRAAQQEISRQVDNIIYNWAQEAQGK